jgi:hypothetical protein
MKLRRRKFAQGVGMATAGSAIPGFASAQSANADRSKALDHVVVLMFENRSFDNLLGRLYGPGEVRSFEGVIGKNLSNPIPEWAEHGANQKTVPYGVATTMNTPNPDPGEEFPHINTDLFGMPFLLTSVQLRSCELPAATTCRRAQMVASLSANTGGTSE